jgi:hypothetical protein
MLRSFPAPDVWCGGYINATGDFRFMRELEMGHTGTSVNILLSRPNREDILTVKSLATGVAAAAAIGAASVGVIFNASGNASDTATTPQVQPVVFGAPMPQDPAADVPTADQLINVLNQLQNPGVPFASKSYLVEGGVGGVEGHIADKRLQKAAANGSLPLSFNIANIVPAGPGTASADVTATGPHLAPTTQNLTFVDQGGWKLSRSSAMTLIQAVQAAGS